MAYIWCCKSVKIMEDWIITYNYNCGVETDTYTANGILDAIQKLSENGIPINDIVEMKLDE